MTMRAMEHAGSASGAWVPDGSNERDVVASILSPERYARLDRKQSYFQCTQHDFKTVDWDGNRVNPGIVGATQPLMQASDSYVPLRQRRPGSPYRLARAVVKAFTAMLLSDKRFPELLCPGDDKGQDYVQALSKECDLPTRAVQIRNLGGSMGTGCASWSFRKGRPRVQSHNAKNIRVHSWEDRDQFVPRHVTEAYKFQRLEYDPEVKRVRYVDYWFRRDWTQDWEVVFFPAKVERGREPVFVPDIANSCEHKDGICHFVWIPNQPTDQEDGDADYEGEYDNFDSLDVMASVLDRGGILNLDPTLKLKMDPDLVNMAGVSKGSDNALVVGEQGDADYLELAGTSIEAGIKLFNNKRTTTLETLSCVFPDPDKVAAGSTSSVALKVIFAPMIGQCDVLRGQYGPGFRRLLEPMLVVARRASRSSILIFDEQGGSQQVQLKVDLPPKVVVDPDTGEVETKQLDPGESERVELEWGPYFLPTPADQQSIVTTLSTATGGKAFMSPKTATEIASEAFGRDGGDEWRTLVAHQADEHEQQQGLFNSAAALGGDVSHTMDLPSGASITRSQKAPEAPEPQQPEMPEVQEDEGAHIAITPTDAAAIVTVNEARDSMGLPPIQGPDGQLTLAAYKVKFAAPIAVAANAGMGKIGAAPATPPPAPMGGPPGGGPPGPPRPPGGAPPAPGGPPKPGGPVTRPGPGQPQGATPAGKPKPPPPRPPMPHPLGPKPPKPGGGMPGT